MASSKPVMSKKGTPVAKKQTVTVRVSEFKPVAKKSAHDAETSRMLAELLETARGLNAHGLLTKTEMGKMQALCEPPPRYTPQRVFRIRTEQAKMSQTMFATLLNVSPSTVQKWESPAANKHPSGPAAKLLQVVEKRGVQALLS